MGGGRLRVSLCQFRSVPAQGQLEQRPRTGVCHGTAQAWVSLDHVLEGLKSALQETQLPCRVAAGPLAPVPPAWAQLSPPASPCGARPPELSSSLGAQPPLAPGSGPASDSEPHQALAFSACWLTGPGLSSSSEPHCHPAPLSASLVSVESSLHRQPRPPCPSPSRGAGGGRRASTQVSWPLSAQRACAHSGPGTAQAAQQMS